MNKGPEKDEVHVLFFKNQEVEGTDLSGIPHTALRELILLEKEWKRIKRKRT
ncbi:hypothetical protein [Bacillus clarus]|uniref:hypothetical protein n=1 Tax=Bacillus clarus TaxID=2338372 RepID=UPI001376FAAB|nr:hypothetical protein [Bacillus clarus]